MAIDERIPGVGGGNDKREGSNNIKKQISRELFVVNQERTNNQPDNCVGDDKLRNYSSAKLQAKSDPFQAMEVERKGGHFDGAFSRTSTPMNSNNSGNVSKVNRSMDGTPTTTSTPNSFRISSSNSSSMKNSFDQSLKTKKRDSLNDSSRNSSMARRNVSNSPLCLADFINVSAASSGGRGNKSKKSTPKFSTCDFPSLESEPKAAKPKKRVVPITVSRKTTPGTPAFVSSSFQSDNNLLNVTPLDGDGSDLNERAMLRDCRAAITKDFSEQQTPQKNLHALIKENLPASVAQSPRRASSTATFNYDDTKVERKDELAVMARLYSFLLDMNLTANILTELSYLISLLNVDRDACSEQQVQPLSTSHLLRSLNNCIFFVVQTLNRQKHVIALLDVTTIRVLIDNERVQQLTLELYEHLKLIHQRKAQLDLTVTASQRIGGTSSSSGVVLYQQDTDNRDNFPTNREFGAFKTQRDLFYGILR